MTARQKMIDHLATLERERDEAFDLGQWERVDTLGLCIDDTRELIKEHDLIQAIKAKPGHQVFLGTDGCSIRVVRTSKSSVGQQSVWLGRRNTISELQRVLAA